MTIYSKPEYADLDIGEQMRHGHPYIAEGDEIILNKIARLEAERGTLTILEVGAGSGYLLDLLRRSGSCSRLVANEVEPALVGLARKRFADADVEVYDSPFDTWSRPVDVIISWGSHHHLRSSDHLDHVRNLLNDRGVLILGDEFCPSYLDNADLRRIKQAEVIYTADGYTLTSKAEVESFLESGSIPLWSTNLERKRRVALWNWYKYVIDVALNRRDDLVVQAELHIAANDLTTWFSDEHKLALPIVERQLELAGFQVQDLLGLEPRPELASFFIMELIVAGRV